ncbi:MAG: hypothetical protein HF962_01435 [Sulfurovum sp.]|nr:hypothetical protein [Sulfurovum sp.]
MKKYTLVISIIFLFGCEGGGGVFPKNADAKNDSIIVPMNQSSNIDVLSNDGNYSLEKKIKSVTSSNNASATIESNKTITYTPDHNYTGTDTFSYVLEVGFSDNTDIATVSIVVTGLSLPVNKAPSVNAGADKQLLVGDTITISAEDNDSDGSIEDRSWKEGSSLLSASKSFEYEATIAGRHTLIYTATDNDRLSSSDEMIITITEREPQTDAPVALDDTILLCCDIWNNAYFTLKAEDRNGDSLTFIKLSDPSYGTLVFENNGTMILRIDTPQASKDCFDGVPNSFRFKANDGENNSSQATITFEKMPS